MSYIWKQPLQKSIDVPGGSSAQMDAVKLALAMGLKYTVCAYNRDEDKSLVFDMNVAVLQTGIEETVFGKVGSVLLFSISVSIVADELVVTVSNGNAYDLTVEFVRATFNN